MFSSPKTTIAGIIVAIGAVLTNVSYLIDGNELTAIDWSVIATQIGIIYGLLTARDNDVTSEETGATTAAKVRSAKY
jgi:hypothetical protein